MSTFVKCNSCNVVIDELLAYVQNKLYVADENTLIKICVSSFTSEEIKQSKSLLYETLPSVKRKIIRKNDGKEKRDLLDIISLLKVVDPDAIPVFVARDLGRLPPISFDHLDASQLLKDLLVLREEVKNIKSSYVTKDQLEELRLNQVNKQETRCLPSAASANNMISHHNESTQRGECVASSQMLFISIPEDSLDKTPSIVHCDSAYTEKDRTISMSSCSDNKQLCSNETVLAGKVLSFGDTSTQRADDSRQLLDSETNLPTEASSYSCATGKTSGPHSRIKCNKPQSDIADDWQYVSRKKKPNYRYRGQTGVACETIGFKAADTKSPIFITNVHMDTLEADIVNYIHSKTQERVSLEIIHAKKQKDHKAYKFFVSDHKVPLFLDENLWPQGIIFRRFVHYKQRYTNNVSNNVGRSMKQNG